MDSTEALLRAINAVLPLDVALKFLEETPAGFHARYSAEGREYLYVIWNGPERAPLVRRTSYAVRDALDEVLMTRASAHLVGIHDFAAFGRPMTVNGPTIRNMMQAGVTRVGDRIEIVLQANAFLRHQVRRTIGFLIAVGRGNLETDHVLALLDGSASGRSAWRAPAHGLTLTKVLYPSNETIATAADRAGRLSGREVENGR